MRTGWLLRDGQVLAAADIADGLADRSRGLAGRQRAEHALILTAPVPPHSIGVPFRIGVAFLDNDLCVMDAVRLAPWRVARPRRKCRVVVESSVEAFDRWGLRVGDRLEVCEVDSGALGTRPLFPPS
jgi:uncharacterized protein